MKTAIHQTFTTRTIFTDRRTHDPLLLVMVLGFVPEDTTRVGHVQFTSDIITCDIAIEVKEPESK